MMKRSYLLFTIFISSCILFSCMPYHSYDRSRTSECLYFDTGKKQIEKVGDEGRYTSLTGMSIEVRYDTVRIINGRPSNMYTLMEVNQPLSFPYRLDTLLADTLKRISISIKTDVREFSYAISLKEPDWTVAKLPFTLYYTISKEKYFRKKK